MFLSPDRFSGRSSVKLVKMNFKPHIRQNYFFKKKKKKRTSRVCVALKTICSYCTLINIKLS